MPWETRAGTDNTYYTRSKRVNGRIVREYLGNGPAAKQAARDDARLRERREQERTELAKRNAKLAECERACVEQFRFVEIYYRAMMLADGFHYHRGEWRKRRVRKQDRHSERGMRPKGRGGNCPPNQVSPNAADDRSPKQHETVPRRRPVPARPPRQLTGRFVRQALELGRNQRIAVPASRRITAPMGLPELRSAGSGLLERPEQTIAVKEAHSGQGRRPRPPPVSIG